MSLAALLSLFMALIALALLPSSSVALVVARSAERGISHGLAAAVGITLADLLLAALALAGWQAVMESLGWLFQLLRWLAAVYLIWFGWTLWRSRPAPRSTPAVTGSLHTSLLAGLMLTLGDIKALVFYASFFPLSPPHCHRCCVCRYWAPLQPRCCWSRGYTRRSAAGCPGH
ncbi:MAG: LysE family translocator [Pseudomonadota bacterium]|jgi:threonine/homoserine/homoserine lactone efflux protein|nr:LysE family translocator [Pseudomonadota bacterium]